MTAPSSKQIGMVHAILGRLGVTDRPDKLRVVSAVVFRQVDSTNDLTRDEAHIVIDTLQGIAQHADNPTRALAGLVAQFPTPACESVGA